MPTTLQARASVASGNPKSQKPSSKQIQNSKSQTETSASAFGIWCLVLVCFLVFVIWCLSAGSPGPDGSLKLLVFSVPLRLCGSFSVYAQIGPTDVCG